MFHPTGKTFQTSDDNFPFIFHLLTFSLVPDFYVSNFSLLCDIDFLLIKKKVERSRSQPKITGCTAYTLVKSIYYLNRKSRQRIFALVFKSAYFHVFLFLLTFPKSIRSIKVWWTHQDRVETDRRIYPRFQAALSSEQTEQKGKKYCKRGKEMSLLDPHRHWPHPPTKGGFFLTWFGRL